MESLCKVYIRLVAEVGIILMHEFQFFFSRDHHTVTCVYGDAWPSLVADQG